LRKVAHDGEESKDGQKADHPGNEYPFDAEVVDDPSEEQRLETTHEGTIRSYYVPYRCRIEPQTTDLQRHRKEQRYESVETDVQKCEAHVICDGYYDWEDEELSKRDRLILAPEQQCVFRGSAGVFFPRGLNEQGKEWEVRRLNNLPL